MGLQASIDISVNGTLTGSDTVATNTDTVRSNSGDFPNLSTAFTDGTGAYQANKWHRSKRTIAAGANDDIDLYGSLVDPRGNVLNFARVVSVVIAIIGADGTKALRIGPNGVANAWQGPFGGVGAGVYLTTNLTLPLIDISATGWPVTAGTGDILRVSNPGAAPLDYVLFVMGN